MKKIAAALVILFGASFAVTAVVETSGSAAAVTPASACAAQTSAPWTVVVNGTQYLCTSNGAPVAL
jgi:hypothetical protein